MFLKNLKIEEVGIVVNQKTESGFTLDILIGFYDVDKIYDPGKDVLEREIYLTEKDLFDRIEEVIKNRYDLEKVCTAKN